MRIQKTASQDEMIALFLKSEWGFERITSGKGRDFDLQGTDPAVITNPDLNNTRQNQEREKLLARFRGWPDSKIFSKFPRDITWHWAEITQDELGEAKFINYSYWNVLSDDTRRVKVAAENVQAGKTVFDAKNDGFFQVVDAIRSGTSIPPMILLAEDESSQQYILEGHRRSVSYALAKTPESLTVLLGIGDGVEQWAAVLRG